MKKLHEVDSPTCIAEVTDRWKWHALEIKRKTDLFPDFEELVKFIDREAQEVTDPVYGQIVAKSDKDGRQKKTASTLLTEVTDVQRKKQSCVLCNEDHKLFYFNKFKQMKPVKKVRLPTFV